MQPLTILLTGASSGIGQQASSCLANQGHRLLLPSRAADAATPCDLADLDNVNRYCDALLAAGRPIDTLVLNAGLQYSGAPQPQWSAQGFELTFAVNQLAHQLLLSRLLPLLLMSPNPRVVITASEVHDPATPGGRVGLPAGLGKLDGLRRGPGAAMLDGFSPFNAEKAYKDSKLCNLLFACELQRRLAQKGHQLPVVAWSPGLVIAREPGGFFRYSRLHNPLGQALFALVARDLLRLSETPQRAGALLAALAVGDPDLPAGFHYLANRLQGPGRHRFGPALPSREAQDLCLASDLWNLCALHADCALQN